MSTISASTTSTTAFKITTDTTGALVFQTGASPTTAMTLGSDQSVTFAGTPTYSGGTANGVAYLNGSKVLTTGTALVFDGTNLGVGVTPSTWFSTYRVVETGSGSLVYAGSTTNFQLRMNNYVSSGGVDTYKNNGIASVYSMGGAGNPHTWYNAASGTAGGTASFTQAMTLTTAGNLLLGTTSSDLSGGGVTTRISTTTATGYAATNVNTGTAAYSVYQLGNNNNANKGGVALFGSGYTSAGLYKQDGVYLYCNGAGGITLAAEASQPIYFATNSIERARFTAAGNLQFITADAGIVFNKTGAVANSILNDYEEGSWLPVMTMGSNSATSISPYYGRYVKIGNWVVFNLYARFNVSGFSGAGSVRISLPFTNGNSNNEQYGSIAISYLSNMLTGVPSGYFPAGYIISGNAALQLTYQNPNGAETAIDNSTLVKGTSVGIMISGSYTTANSP